MKSHLHRVSATYRHLKKPIHFGVSVIVALACITGVVAYTNTSKTIHTSELSFIERSKNPNIAGGIVPASCQSYPVMGPTHAIDSHGGHCAGTCPSGYDINVRPMYRSCVYFGPFNAETGTQETYYIELYASESCPAYHPLGYSLTSQDVTSAPVCSKMCSDSSWAFPHLGIYCPSTAVAPTSASISYSPTSGDVSAAFSASLSGDNSPTYFRYQTVVGAGTACPGTPLTNTLYSTTYGPTTGTAEGLSSGTTYKTCVQACNDAGCSPANGSATYEVTGTTGGGTGGGTPTINLYFTP